MMEMRAFAVEINIDPLKKFSFHQSTRMTREYPRNSASERFYYKAILVT